MPKKIAIIGNGGREHAFAYTLQESGEIISMPGNPGMAEIGECFAIDLSDPEAIAEVARREGVDLAVVGPEVPLVAGAVDALKRADVYAFGPSETAAQLEGSKAFMKDIAHAAGVPTAEYDVFSAGQQWEAIKYYESLPNGGVIKTDGLAAGKGVAIPKDSNEANQTIVDYLSGRAFGEAGKTIVIEEKLTGGELSLFVLCDGVDAVSLGTARDYKRLLDGDEGPNTGGMGSYSPTEEVSKEFVDELMRTGVTPTLDYLCERGTPYHGILYAGFMLTENGPMLLEYNVRFGDPEAQVVLPRIKSDLSAHLYESAIGDMHTPIELSEGAAVTVALTAQGYPEHPRKGDRIEGVEQANQIPGATVFHGGTAMLDGELHTAGGRVLYATGFGPEVADARARAYIAAEQIDFSGMHKRTDIADVE